MLPPVTGAVELELEDVDVIGGFDDGVGTAAGALYLGLGELSHEAEDEVEDHLIVAFGLVVQLVGYPGEDGPQAGEEGVDVTRFEFTGKFTDVKRGVGFPYRSVERQGQS